MSNPGGKPPGFFGRLYNHHQGRNDGVKGGPSRVRTRLFEKRASRLHALKTSVLMQEVSTHSEKIEKVFCGAFFQKSDRFAAFLIP
jgi:hypothetical protein